MRKTIPSFPNYEAGIDGHIYRNGSVLAERNNGKNYLAVFPRRDGKTHTEYVHRLVCEAFSGPCPDGMQCRHLDNDRGNNRPGNLEWATKEVNELDKKRFGTIVRGEASSHSVLTEEIVKKARERALARERMDKIALSYGINPKVMADAITGRRWGWLPGAVPVLTTRRRFKDDEILEIRKMMESETHLSISVKFNVCRQTIANISCGITYGHVK